MKTYKFTEDQMKGFNFHRQIIAFHEMVIKNWVKQLAELNLKRKITETINYDLNKGEFYLEKPKKVKK